MNIHYLTGFINNTGNTVLAYMADFQAGSGLSAGNQLGTLIKQGLLALVLFWIIWVIAAAWRSWGAEKSDSASLVSILIRGAVMSGLIGILLTLM